MYLSNGGGVGAPNAAGPGGGGGCGEIITVGTPTQVAGLVDPYGTLLTDLVAANPSPYNVTPWVPYVGSWIYSGGNDAPLQFFLDGCMVAIRGAAVGGASSSIIFYLPTGFRPFYQQELIVPTGSPTDYAAVLVGADGSVLYEDTV